MINKYETLISQWNTIRQCYGCLRMHLCMILFKYDSRWLHQGLGIKIHRAQVFAMISTCWAGYVLMDGDTPDGMIGVALMGCESVDVDASTISMERIYLTWQLLIMISVIVSELEYHLLITRLSNIVILARCHNFSLILV